MPTNRVHRIAVIPGDGIGKEVMPEGVRVLEAAAKKFGFELRQDHFDFASYDYYARHQKMMPDDWKDQIGGHDAIFFGAVGWPAKIPDHISLWGSLILFRREFDQYVNLRPVRLMPGVPSPLANRKPGDIDFWVVRENTEGEYSAIGGRAFPGTDREIVIQETVLTRVGVDRVLKFAFELARKTPKKHLTSATKSNGIAITMPYWDERVEEMAKSFPDVKWNKFHIDILSALFVLKPDTFNVVVASNLFGDILSDLGPACTGTIGIAPSGNINPERKFPSVFEPVHGSAPDIAGQGIANPIGQIWSGAMMLEHLGETEAAAAIVKAIEKVLAEQKLRTRDLGGPANTSPAAKRSPRHWDRSIAFLVPDKPMPLKIYGIARTRAFRALWMAMELGIDYEHDPVEIGDAGARAPEFLAINPNGRLPVIVDDGFVLFESLAITMYLAKKHSAGKLYPATIEGEARLWQWSSWALTEVDRGVNIWSLHAVRLPEAERDAAKRAEALKVLVAPFKVLDAAASAQPYLLGNDFTVADLNVAAVISRAIEMDLSAVPNLKAWLTRCLERPAARRALALKNAADAATPVEVTRRIARTNRL